MAVDKKISQLTSLAQVDVAASTDVLPIVDTSATETKKITVSALVGAGATAGLTNVDINSGTIDGTTIGASSASTGAFTTLSSTGASNFATSSGNVGIGTTTTAAGGLLTLNRAPAAAFGTPMMQVGGASFTAGGYYSIGLGFTDATYTEPPGEIVFITDSSSGGTNGAIAFGTRSVTTNTAVTERMRIDSSGNVGIGGTANATDKVTIAGTLPSNSGYSLGFINRATIPSTSTTAYQGFTSLLYTQAASFTLADAVHFQAQQVTIGAGSAVTNQYGFYCTSLTGATNNYGFFSNIASGSNRWNFYAAGTAANYMAGALSVGTTAAGVAGEIRATNNITAYYSDARLKDFKGKIDGALDKVSQLNGYYYTENAKAEEYGYNNKAMQVGVSAQEVQAVLPEIVTAAPFDLDTDNKSKSGENYMTVRYERLVPLLIEAIKELKAEVEALKGAK